MVDILWVILMLKSYFISWKNDGHLKYLKTKKKATFGQFS